ncbi:NnrU family protein [Pseudogemmobacter humi]|uniref:NnrU protein n=1 Tax=Pseudogemmobacter humi TaxID=2483812 RepID=A0A3P5X9Y2_9RHOB|nr:NnrU family protein [Pseudogemmobacter humi]VDC25247.1 NnrU protein [Pseudogemmobacter humi]
MFSLALGVLLWSAAHLFKRLAPASREGMGAGGRGTVALLVLASIGLMIFGYRIDPGTFYWGRSPMTTGINNLMMLVSVYFFAAAGMKTALARRLRHPMLWGVVIWSAAHLLVNGDSPSFVLFGGLGLWALVQMAAINRHAGPFVPPPPKPAKMEWIAVAGTLVVYGALAGAHYLLGYPVFG